MLNTTMSTWTDVLSDEKQKPYFQEILNNVHAATKTKCVYPTHRQRFNAFTMTSFESVKVVILGQDPYHGPGQAHGLSFSVPKGIAIPPSLINIYKEIQSDINIMPPSHGCLESWAMQGVLLLNSCLSVEHGVAGSHRHLGWEVFTDNVIAKINTHHSHVVFLLWGAFAQKKAHLINTEKHLILCAPHPSPLSAHRGFLGCRHFSKTNHYLNNHDIEPIDWQIEN